MKSFKTMFYGMHAKFLMDLHSIKTTDRNNL